MIEVDRINKTFGVSTALDDVSFQVESGEILGLLGPNGAGKTTMMRILTGFLAPTSGNARVGGFDIQKNALDAKRKFGYLPESAPVYKDIRIINYLQYVCAMKSIPQSERKKQIESVMGKCGLSDVKSRIIGNLSKGYRQRVGLAQALLGDPEILILDEPTEGLDPKQIIDIRNLIREFGGNRTVILSTHILPEVSMVCERVIILNKGKLIAVDTPENLTSQMQNQSIITVGVIGPAEHIESTIKEIPGVISAELQADASNNEENTFCIQVQKKIDIRSRLAEKIVSNRWKLIELHTESLSLEEIFVHLVTQEKEG